MLRTDLEKLAREMWQKAGAKPAEIERLTATVVGLAYSEKLLDQGRKP